jgi:site-specific recombinase XerD
MGFEYQSLAAGDFQMPNGWKLTTIQELPGHADGRTTMIYTGMLNRGDRGVRSTLDPL